MKSSDQLWSAATGRESVWANTAWSQRTTAWRTRLFRSTSTAKPVGPGGQVVQMSGRALSRALFTVRRTSRLGSDSGAYVPLRMTCPGSQYAPPSSRSGAEMRPSRLEQGALIPR